MSLIQKENIENQKYPTTMTRFPRPFMPCLLYTFNTSKMTLSPPSPSLTTSSLVPVSAILFQQPRARRGGQGAIVDGLHGQTDNVPHNHDTLCLASSVWQVTHFDENDHSYMF